MAKSKKWMSKAFSNSHGQFKAKAEKAGMSTKKFADHALAENSKASTKTKRQAALAERGMDANHSKKSRSERWYGKKD
jgi:hypothetical protein